jgi:hypothetical protein
MNNAFGVTLSLVAWEASGQSQVVAILLMVFLGVIGTAVYVVAMKPKLHVR